MADEDSYCGTKWLDAYTHCHRRCDPENNDAECKAALGPDYACQTYTLCTARIASGEVVSESPSSGDAGSTSQDPSPVTSDESSADDASGKTQEEYWSMPGETASTDSPAITDDSGSSPSGSSAQTPQEGGGGELGKKWYLNTGEYSTACTYGDDYPPAFAELEMLREKFIFDAIDDCCDTYPTACGRPEPVVTTSPTINMTAAPNTAKPSYAPTYAPTMFEDDDYEVMEGNGVAMPGVAWGVIAAVLLSRALRL